MNVPRLLLPLAMAGALMSGCATTSEVARDDGPYRTSDSWRTGAPDVRGDLRYAPRWRLVSGTRVYVPSDADLAYDLFRVGNLFFAYNGDSWYRASRWNDDYAWVNPNDVPWEISRVPEREWRSYPYDWANRTGRDSDDRDSNDRTRDRDWGRDRYDRGTYDYRTAPPPPRISMGTQPRWRLIPRTGVYGATNLDFDVFRIGQTYFLYNDGYWYRSNRWSGGYSAISDERLPRDFRQIPRDEWRHGPPPWANARSNREGSYR